MESLKRRSKFFASKIKYKKDSKLSDYLKIANVRISREGYIGICMFNLVIYFVILFILSTTILALVDIDNFLVFGFLIAFAFSFFLFFSQMVYPRIFVTRRKRNIEKNLIPALQDMLVQLESGIPLFTVLVNISSSDYEELSIEFKKIVRKISAGRPEQTVLEEVSKSNSSVFLKRTLWQISNGMNSGSDMSIVVRDSIKNLNEEQMIQIQNYGNKLNPLIVFYMLIAIIVPALSIAFLTIISSMVGLNKGSTTLLFLGLFVFVILIQIMFLGIIKSKRPSLL
jgi:flagellar protein FlaJ